MKIVNPNVEIMHTGLETNPIRPEQHIEKVGRTCYKSEDKITDVSAEKFVGALIKRGHEAVIEHWSMIFRTKPMWYEEILADWGLLMHNGNIPIKNRLRPFLRFTDWTTEEGESRCIVSGNMRAWRDYIKACVEGFGFVPMYLHGLVRNNPLFFPEYQDYTPATFYNDIFIPITVSDLVGDVEKGVHWDITVKFTCDRGVSHEIVRHRPASYAQESTRYCNYGLGKFGSEITVVKPAQWLNNDDFTNPAYQAWYHGCSYAEKFYFDMLDGNATPQEARAVLPNSLKTEVVMTGNLNEWDHFCKLRCAADAHPDIQVVAKLLKTELDKVREYEC